MLLVRDNNTIFFLFFIQIGNNLGENLDLLLRGVLSKLQQAETLSIIQVNHGRICCSTRFIGILGANLLFVQRLYEKEKCTVNVWKKSGD